MQNEQDTGLGLWVFQQYHGRQFFNGGDHSTQSKSSTCIILTEHLDLIT
jgi:hypothetical protein